MSPARHSQFQVPVAVSDLQISLKRLERRDWWLWLTAVTILLLLCFAVFSFSLVPWWQDEGSLLRGRLEISVRALFGLVLLFSVFAFYEQWMIKKLRAALEEQIAVAAALHVRAEAYERLAILDPLTGLFNRRFVADYLPREISRCERGDSSLVVMMIDLDDFKIVNDTYGHLVGDAALKGFAQHIRKAIRSADLAVRFGGDEFMVILSECGVEDVLRPIERMRAYQLLHGSDRIPISFSVGWAEHRTGGSAAEVIERADAALYEQKRLRQEGQSAPI